MTSTNVFEQTGLFYYYDRIEKCELCFGVVSTKV